MTTAHTLTTLSVVCLLFLAGCATDQVQYVDEQGNVLAQDEAGQPILPASSQTATGPADPSDERIRVGDVFPAPSGSTVAKPARMRPVTTQPKATARGRVFPVAVPTITDPLGAPPTGNAPPSATPAYGPSSAASAPTPAPAKPVAPASSSAGLGTPPTQR